MSVILKTQGELQYFAAEGISVPHCFTTRLVPIFILERLPLLTPPRRVVKQWGTEIPSAAKY